jgi:hypothetical protein
VTTADLLLHPIRLRILQAFMGDRALTTSQIRSELPDVPVASLYRHVARLVEAGVLNVVAEQRVRGALERTYVLRQSASAISLDELERMSPDEHRQGFIAFAAGLIADFDRYAERGDIDYLRDYVGYRMNALWLYDAEMATFVRDLNRVVQPRLANGPNQRRSRRLFATVMLPAENVASPAPSHTQVPTDDAS